MAAGQASRRGLSASYREAFGALAASRSGRPLVVLGAWVALIAASTIYRADFLSRQTLLSITFTMAVLGVVTVAESLVTISGGILDLSIPTELILPAWVIVTLLGHGVNIVLVIVAGLLTGAAWGCSTP